MRRVLVVLAFALGLGVSLGAHANVGVAQETVGPVSLEIHAASCPVNYPSFGLGGVYESCHHNGIEGAAFTYASVESAPVAIVSDVSGVGVGMILDGVSGETGATLVQDVAPPLGAYAYCKDQIGGVVLFDGRVDDATGIVELGAVTADMQIICDWYNYEAAVQPVG